MSDDDSGSQKPRRMTLVATVVACTLVAVYLVALLLQWASADSMELTWARREQLLDGLQALGFAAAGALLGTSVQSRVTRQVEDRANKADHRAKLNERDAEKGRALQRAIEAQVGDQSPVGSPRDLGDVERGGPTPTSATGVLGNLLNLARLYDSDQ